MARIHAGWRRCASYPAYHQMLLSPFEADGEHSSRSPRGRNHAYGDQLANALRRSGASIGCGFAPPSSPRTMAVHCTPPICFTPTSFTRAFYHRIGGLNQRNQPRVSIILMLPSCFPPFTKVQNGPPIQPVCGCRVRGFTSARRGTAATNASSISPHATAWERSRIGAASPELAAQPRDSPRR